MHRNGQAKVLTNGEFETVLSVIEAHRHPARNATMVQVAFKLGLRVQEKALLRLPKSRRSAISFQTATH